MNLPVHRKTDPNTGGGKIQTIPQSSVYANNLLVSVDGSKGTGHGDGIHAEKAWETANGNPTVFIENIPMNNKGDADTCGHSREDGSPNVFWNEVIRLTGVEFPEIEIIDDPEISRENVLPSANNYTVQIYFTDTQRTVEYTVQEEYDEPLPPPPAEVVASCGGFTNNTPTSTQLSTYFTLGDLTTNTVFQGQSGKYPTPQSLGPSWNRIFSIPEIICNLKALAENSLDPFAAEFGRRIINVNSGFRLKNGRNSWHHIGCAADLQIPSWSSQPNWAELYFEGAKWIRDNIIFDKFLYEIAGNRPWYHISYNRVGEQRREVYTFINHSKHASGLRRLG